MLIRAAVAAWKQVMSQGFRRILWLSIGLTVGLLVLVWTGLTRLLGYLLSSYPLSAQYPVIDGYIVLASGFGLVIVLLYLLPAVTAIVAGYFIDDAAAIVEQKDFPGDRPGEAAPLLRSLLYGLRFAGLSLLVNLVALAFLFLPGINLIAFFMANAYLLGREYFELAAGRFLTAADAAAMRKAYRGTVLGAGAIMAVLLMVPVVNLLTPLFGIALMVHVYKRLQKRQQRSSTVSSVSV